MKKTSKITKTSGKDQTRGVMRKTSFVFFGSGPVAARSLELLAQNFTIEAVVTKPKPPHHKEAFPVLETAKKLGLAVHTVKAKSELSELIARKPFRSDLGVLIDFGIIVGQDVIDYFPMGIINSHFSILPELRGADPITFAILSGQETTGVSLMVLVEKMDEGPLLSFGEYRLPPDVTTPQLTEHLIGFSVQMLQRELPRLVAGAKPAPQEITKRSVSYSRKLTKNDGVIDWKKPAVEIEREIRAFIEWPKSRTNLAGKDVIITKAHVVPTDSTQAKPGDICIVPESEAIVICTGRESLCIDRLKPAGKNEMTSKEFVAGYMP